MMKLKTPKPVHFHPTSFVQLQLTQIFLCSHFLFQVGQRKMPARLFFSNNAEPGQQNVDDAEESQASRCVHRKKCFLSEAYFDLLYFF